MNRQPICRPIWLSASQIERARLLGRLTPEVETCIRTGREQGFSWDEISRRLGWSKGTVHRWGKLLGLDTTSQYRSAKINERNETIRRLRATGMQWKTIAPHVGMSTTGCAKAGLAALRSAGDYQGD